MPLDTLDLEIFLTGDTVQIKAPEAVVSLSKTELQQLIEFSERIRDGGITFPHREKINASFEISNFKAYLEFAFIMHTGPAIEHSTYMLDKAKLNDFIAIMKELV